MGSALDLLKQIRMRVALLLLLLVLGFAFPGQSRATVRDDGWDLALEAGIPGKGGWKTCYPFARNLQWRFDMAGGESHLVIYNWTGLDRETGRHALVVYRDAAGRYWGVDAMSPKPRWVPGTTPAEWASFWAAQSQSMASGVSDATNRKYFGHTADKTLLAGVQVAESDAPTVMHRHSVPKTI